MIKENNTGGDIIYKIIITTIITVLNMFISKSYTPIFNYNSNYKNIPKVSYTICNS